MVSILIFLPATFGIHEGPLGCKEHHAGKCRNPCQSSKKHEHYFQLSYQVCISFLSNPFSLDSYARETSVRQSAIFLFTIPAEVCSCPYSRPQLIPSFVAYRSSLGNLKRFQSKANERQNKESVIWASYGFFLGRICQHCIAEVFASVLLCCPSLLSGFRFQCSTRYNEALIKFLDVFCSMMPESVLCLMKAWNHKMIF